MSKLDYKRMLQEIDELTNTDFAFDMECKRLPASKPYSQEEASKMQDLLGRVYRISHCIQCGACQRKYVIK